MTGMRHLLLGRVRVVIGVRLDILFLFGIVAGDPGPLLEIRAVTHERPIDHQPAT